MGHKYWAQITLVQIISNFTKASVQCSVTFSAVRSSDSDVDPHFPMQGRGWPLELRSNPKSVQASRDPTGCLIAHLLMMHSARNGHDVMLLPWHRQTPTANERGRESVIKVDFGQSGVDRMKPRSCLFELNGGSQALTKKNCLLARSLCQKRGRCTPTP